MEETKWKWECKHICGHQDKKTPHYELDIWAKLNVDCDYAAGMCRTRLEWNKDDSTNLPIYCSPWLIKMNGYSVLDDMQTELHNCVHRESVFTHWANHKHNPCLVPMEVNWEAIGKATRTMSQSRRQWCVKQASHWLPHNGNEHKWNVSETEQCPACDQKETVLHIHQCNQTRIKCDRMKTLMQLPEN